MVALYTVCVLSIEKEWGGGGLVGLSCLLLTHSLSRGYPWRVYSAAVSSAREEYIE